MASLGELHAMLAELGRSGRNAKVFFYFVGDDDQKLHSGNIVVDAGATCYLSLFEFSAEQALERIPGLRFTKVSSLPAMATDHSGDAQAGLQMEQVLAWLDPANQAVPEPEPEPAPVQAHVAETPAAAPVEQKAFYSHVALQKDATDLLATVFGDAAANKKVEEFARQTPPFQHPHEFVDKCRQHAAMMLGARKAEELFQPLHDRIRK